MFEKRNITLLQTDDVAMQLLDQFRNARIFAFFGEMGAGKTTFIQSFCRAIGSPDTVTSPSFAIINEYSDISGNPVYHFDFYRIKNLEEAFDLGYEDYIYSGFYCLIEWPEKIEQLLPESYIEVTVMVQQDGKRSITAKPSV